jgi:hypothetical protein
VGQLTEQIARSADNAVAMCESRDGYGLDYSEASLAIVEAMLSEANTAYDSFRSREKVYSSQEKFKAQQSDLLSIQMRRQELEADRRNARSRKIAAIKLVAQLDTQQMPEIKTVGKSAEPDHDRTGKQTGEPRGRVSQQG